MTPDELQQALTALEDSGMADSDYARELYSRLAELEAAAFRELLSPLTDAYRHEPA